ncbi:hypothetical protein ACWCP6_02375 [Streptomyces sp. NPDC002004]
MSGDEPTRPAPPPRMTVPLPRPLACAVAVTALSVALHLAAPAASHAVHVLGGTRTAGVSAALAPDVGGRASGGARAAGTRARTAARLPGASWTLRADRLVLHGTAFRGVVTVRTAAGSRRMLKFTARSLDIGGLDMTTDRGGSAPRLRAGPGTATVTAEGGGVVTLYMRKLSGTVAGRGGAAQRAGRGVTVTPDAVPRWLTRPTAPVRTLALENVTVSRVAQFGGRLSVTAPVLRPRAE